jgi:hypothetical protein
MKPLKGSAKDYESRKSPAKPSPTKLTYSSDNKTVTIKDVTNWGKNVSGVDSRPLSIGTSCPYDCQK